MLTNNNSPFSSLSSLATTSAALFIAVICMHACEVYTLVYTSTHVCAYAEAEEDVICPALSLSIHSVETGSLSVSGSDAGC